MKNPTRLLLPATLAGVLLFVSACSKKSGADSHDDHAHHGHVHTAPHGGVLVEVGDHQFNLEFVHDRAAGSLTVYVLDAHAENFVRVALPALDFKALVNGAPQPLRLLATANSATGETVGDTSQFTATADFLKSPDAVSLTLPELPLRGHVFKDLAVALPVAR